MVILVVVKVYVANICDMLCGCFVCHVKDQVFECIKCGCVVDCCGVFVVCLIRVIHFSCI